ncbi:Protein kinase of the Mitotic Exit Network [Friedmanniomyces endolithicus]|uniref:non-specific serine/threonine protein kinase n=1 Tax=Friedmanniomyces endolithicus TaxID=329885 RepID=A0AAN6L4Q8_9PEZI|nr:Protein kinase of the Mitotic Exit Network [Friedmanniomyces endolithicus]KAK0800333.1 Protein kinase of the Mitotic Exit Network [Friedmanniomyces endolithicus]KAK0806551.1 Protein kinase of the Mitotic Exit Network [Friedmanniomyces endolithicus]KAK0817191.1 Protein kinase of the Mitotic Exit Network [Friedmanniomyces endolithicus]KAK0854471.1 Protein kinase of the Mitotic Exit Network [Friedmanniomyces endolithicus]
MPPLPSSPPVRGQTHPTAPKTTISRASTVTRRPGSAASVRRPPSVASSTTTTAGAASRNGTPKVSSQTGATAAASSRLQPVKPRGSSDKENSSGGKVAGGGGSKVIRGPSRRQSSASVMAREKQPSKDGTAQRNAKEVEGLKDFQLGDCLGRGAFGSVYRALNWSTGETVAIKQVSLSHLPRGDLTVIMQEIDLLKNLNHPNIVKYHGFVKSVENLYIILEYCENGSLHSICKNFGKFPENLVSLYTAQVLQGLLFLHEQGVIHRDIKGANILTTKEGLVKLADFGVATKQADGSSVVGTPYWMAPEVIELSGASTASDIWSLGCTVIELLDGKPPYSMFAPMPALFRIVNDDHPPLPEGVSPLVRDFLMQCFQKDPNLRVSAKKLLRHPWILGTKKGDAGKPVKHEEAVNLVEEWNNALKSSPKAEQRPDAGSRRSSARPGSRPVSRNDAKDAKSKYDTPAVGTRSVFQLGAKREKPTKLYASPEDDEKRDNWDEDFESLSTTFRALQLPEHRRPQDNFAGLFTAEKLKQYASDAIPEMDGKVEQWDEEFPDGELTVRSPLQLTKGDALETVRPFYPPRTTSDDMKHRAPFGLAKLDMSGPQLERKGSRDSQPKTQILRPVQKSTAVAGAKQSAALASNKALPLPAAANKERFREGEDDEDYSDLVPDDESAFQQKLAGFSPSRAYDPRDLRGIQTKLGGSGRRRTHTPTNMVHDAAAMKRTRSSLEIQKYAEDDEDEDFADVIFGEDAGTPMQLQPAKQRSPQSASMGSDSTGSGDGTMKMVGSATWLHDDEEDDEDDPFAALEEELDAVDLESNVARDKHARLCTSVEDLVSDLKRSKPDDMLDDIVEQLLHVLSESPDVKTVIVSSHGMLPILEILETCNRPYTILSLLRIVNCIISDNVEVQENLCFVGGIPIVTKFAHKKFSSEIRLEAAEFVRMMYQTSTLTLQMFVSCGGLNVLVEFLEEDYETDAGRELVLLGVNGIWSVFELQGPTPKNDFCRIFSRSSVLYPLSLVLSRILDEEGELAVVFEGRIVNIFVLFSQAENHVKEAVADRMVLKRVLKDLRRMSPQHQITMLKFIKNLSMLATTLDALQNSNAIEVLTDLLGASMKAPHFREVSNQVLNTMYNLCRLSKARQEDAALNGLVPLLQRIVQTERPLKEFALPILCDMAHSGKVGRMVLWQNKGLQFYVSLLADQYWAVTALDAIFIWLQEETHKVEQHLLSTTVFADAITQCFNVSKADVFESLLEPLQKLLRLSRDVAASLAQRTLFERCAVKLHAKKPLVRLNLLRILRSICEAHEEQGSLMRQYGLLESVQDLAASDPAILVREMAKSLLECVDPRPPVASRGYPGMRRTSSSTMTPPPPLPSGHSASSMPPTPVDRAGSHSGFFDFGMDVPKRSARPVAPSSRYRPASRDAKSGSSASSAKYVTASTSLAHPPPPPPTNTTSTKSPAARLLPARSSAASLRLAAPQSSRSSLAPSSSRLNMHMNVSDGGADKVSSPATEYHTPTHMPPSANTRGASSMAAAAGDSHARRRRQTSGAELMRHS